jgi:hypothetical protein
MPRRLPIAGAQPRTQAPNGALGEAIWPQGLTFLELVDEAGAARVAMDAAFDAVHLPPALQNFFTTFPRRARILALADLEEEESRLLLARVERLCSLGKQLWMRTFPVAKHPDLVRRFASPQRLLLVFFGDDRQEFARWQAPLAEASHAGEGRSTRSRSDPGLRLARELAGILAPYAALPIP